MRLPAGPPASSATAASSGALGGSGSSFASSFGGGADDFKSLLRGAVDNYAHPRTGAVRGAVSRQDQAQTGAMATGAFQADPDQVDSASTGQPGPSAAADSSPGAQSDATDSGGLPGSPAEGIMPGVLPAAVWGAAELQLRNFASAPLASGPAAATPGAGITAEAVVAVQGADPSSGAVAPVSDSSGPMCGFPEPSSGGVLQSAPGALSALNLSVAANPVLTPLASGSTGTAVPSDAVENPAASNIAQPGPGAASGQASAGHNPKEGPGPHPAAVVVGSPAVPGSVRGTAGLPTSAGPAKDAKPAAPAVSTSGPGIDAPLVPPAVTGAPTPLATAPGTPSGTATASAAPSMPPLAQQLARPIFSLAAGPRGDHIMTINVVPETLGPVTIRAHLGSDGIRIELVSATDAGRDGLRTIMGDLKRDLAAGGMPSTLSLGSTSGGSAGSSGAAGDQGGRGQDGSFGLGSGGSPGSPSDAGRGGQRGTGRAGGASTNADSHTQTPNGPRPTSNTALDITV